VHWSPTGYGLSNSTISYTYYSTGVLAVLTYPAYGGHMSPTVNYAYNNNGQLLSSTDWLGNEVTYTYDADGNLTNQDNNASGSTRVRRL